MHPDTYTVSLPYPDTRAVRPDPQLARRLFPLYIGPGGEFSALSNYLCAALHTEISHPELSDIFDTVAQTELQHFRLLGALLRDLGVNPTIHARIDTLPLPADTGARSLRELFAQSLRSEQLAADTYRYLMGQTRDEAVYNLLHRIMLDEEAHARLFTALLN